MNKWYKGFYTPMNPGKYTGNIDKITFRSSWENLFMRFCDTTPEILKWGSEVVAIPYYDPVQKKERRYFVDFRIVTRQADGSIKVTLIEIKPYKQTQRPRASRNKSEKTMITEQAAYFTNMAKWEAAKKFSKALGWEFRVFTERDLYGDIDRAYKPPRQ